MEDSGLEFWHWYLLTQWYTRIPDKAPAMKVSTAVIATAIPTVAPVVRDCTVAVGGGKYGFKIQHIAVS